MHLLQALFAVWIAASIAVLFFFIPVPNTQFDDGRLYQAAKAHLFDQQFAVLAESRIEKDIANTVIHFSSEKNCFCGTLARKHIESVKKSIANSGGNNIEILLHNHSEWLQFIPATPSVAVFDSTGKLAYLGPYSTGAGCFTGSGIVENYINIQSVVGATVLSDAQGCYCRVTS